MASFYSLFDNLPPKISGWQEVFEDANKRLSLQQIELAIQREIQVGKTVFPPVEKVFSAFKQCAFDALKVVILGQDPYHHPGQAHGLSFSVPSGVKPPPSLRNIFKTLHQDVAMPLPDSGNLEPWAKQGVLLLNAILTVNAFEPASHRKFGWETFTDALIYQISQRKRGVVFMLWGSFARSKASLIDPKKHLILEAPHPSPLSAHQGFFTCQHFSKCNAYLQALGKTPIDWSIQSQSFLAFPEDQDTT